VLQTPFVKDFSKQMIFFVLTRNEEAIRSHRRVKMGPFLGGCLITVLQLAFAAVLLGILQLYLAWSQPRGIGQDPP